MTTEQDVELCCASGSSTLLTHFRKREKKRTVGLLVGKNPPQILTHDARTRTTEVDLLNSMRTNPPQILTRDHMAWLGELDQSGGDAMLCK